MALPPRPSEPHLPAGWYQLWGILDPSASCPGTQPCSPVDQQQLRDTSALPRPAVSGNAYRERSESCPGLRSRGSCLAGETETDQPLTVEAGQAFPRRLVMLGGWLIDTGVLRYTFQWAKRLLEENQVHQGSSYLFLGLLNVVSQRSNWIFGSGAQRKVQNGICTFGLICIYVVT